jgi:hypothetical protein
MRRQSRHRTKGGFEFGISDRYRSWKPPKGTSQPSAREIARAMDTIPTDINWTWASERLVPLLERPGADPMPENPQLVATADCGVSYGFGMDLGPLFARVTRSLADRWERDEATIRDVALANLRRRLYDDAPDFEVPSNPGDALVVRALKTPEGFASSVVLVPDALKRIFGDEDLILAAPCRPLLLAFPIDTPAEVIDSLTQEAEKLDPNPLYLDPFRLVGGRLRWDGYVPAIEAASS